MIIRFGGHDWHFSLWRVFWLVVGAALLSGVIVFGYSIWSYYRAIRSGEINPFFDRRLMSSVSRLKANREVSDADLAQLDDPRAPSTGRQDANLTIVEFIDYNCPFSRVSFEPVRELMTVYGDRVKLVVRDFPVHTEKPGTVRAAIAARCAQKQDKFWVYHDKLFLNQGAFEDEDLRRYAAEVGLEAEAFSQCLASSQTEPLVEADQIAGLNAGVEGTPTFFFNGRRLQGALDREVLDFLIKKFLE